MKFKIYDYDNKATIVEIPDKPIDYIHVIVLSGDETGVIYFKDDTTQSFDASKHRFFDYFDDQYVVPGNQVEKWASIKPHVDEYEIKSYKRANAWRKLACSSN